MRQSLIAAEIRRASDKAAWYEHRGEPQRAMQYRAYAKRLASYPPEIAERVINDAVTPTPENS